MKLRYTGRFELTKAHKNDIGFDLHPESCTLYFKDGSKYDIDCTSSGVMKEKRLREVLTYDAMKHPFRKSKRGVVKIVFDTGTAIAPPEGVWMMAVPNSRVCKTEGFVLQNSVGIIDPGYRGKIKMTYVSIEPSTNEDDILMLMRTCGQLLPFNISLIESEKCDKLDSTDRGTKGFGSSDVSF